MSNHKHKAESERTVSWTRCVSTDPGCSGHAHGGVTFVERCKCGAEREARFLVYCPASRICLLWGAGLGGRSGGVFRVAGGVSVVWWSATEDGVWRG